MKKGTAWILVGLLLIAAALYITLYNLWDSARAGKAADAVLEELLPQIEEAVPMPDEEEIWQKPDEVEYPDYVLNPDMDMPIKVVDGNDYIGVLNLESLGKKFPVLSSWSYPNLKISPCRYTGSVYKNNLVIAAHNYRKHFGDLSSVKLGDPVIFTDMAGNVFHYQVAEVDTLRGTAVKEMTSGDWDLTLFTCTISGQSRVTIRCTLAEES